MHDPALARVRDAHRRRYAAGTHGTVDQARTAGRLFAGDFTASTTAGAEFGGSLLGLGVMHDLAGEVVSVDGRTWRVPPDGTPVLVGPDEGVAFGIAAHGGTEHRLTMPPGLAADGIVAVIDAALADMRIDHEHVVCAVRVDGSFDDVLLRTVAPATRAHESLGEIIDDEIRFAFSAWTGTLVGFRFPDDTDGRTIPGLHLHALGTDRASGGHVRNVTTGVCVARIWVDDLDAVTDSADAADEQQPGGTPIDFARYEGAADRP